MLNQVKYATAKAFKNTRTLVATALLAFAALSPQLSSAKGPATDTRHILCESDGAGRIEINLDPHGFGQVFFEDQAANSYILNFVSAVEHSPMSTGSTRLLLGASDEMDRTRVFMGSLNVSIPGSEPEAGTLGIMIADHVFYLEIKGCVWAH